MTRVTLGSVLVGSIRMICMFSAVQLQVGCQLRVTVVTLVTLGARSFSPAALLRHSPIVDDEKSIPTYCLIHRGLPSSEEELVCGSPESEPTRTSRGAEAPPLHRIRYGAGGRRGDALDAGSSHSYHRVHDLRISRHPCRRVRGHCGHTRLPRRARLGSNLVVCNETATVAPYTVRYAAEIASSGSTRSRPITNSHHLARCRRRAEDSLCTLTTLMHTSSTRAKRERRSTPNPLIRNTGSANTAHATPKATVGGSQRQSDRRPIGSYVRDFWRRLWRPAP